MRSEGVLESLGRCLLGLLAAVSVLVLILAGLGVRPFEGTTVKGTTAQGTAPQSERIALERSMPAKVEKQQQLALEQKVGECYSRGGVARLDAMSGYTGCDLPVPKSRSR